MHEHLAGGEGEVVDARQLAEAAALGGLAVLLPADLFLGEELNAGDRARLGGSVQLEPLPLQDFDPVLASPFARSLVQCDDFRLDDRRGNLDDGVRFLEYTPVF